MQRFSLLFARLAVTMWVGGAVLFVITSVAEQVRPSFSQIMKNELALVRFPLYYSFGFTLLGATLVAGHFARRHPDVSRASRWLLPTVLCASLLLMTIDYQHVYLPLASLVTPPDRAVPSEFGTYHRASMWINIAHVGLAFWGAILLCLPPRPAPPSEPQAMQPRTVST